MAYRQERFDLRNGSSPDTFQELLARLLRINLIKSNSHSIDVNLLIDQLNCAEFNASCLSEMDLDKLVNYLCSILSPETGQLTVKGCMLLSHLLSCNNIIISDESLTKLVTFLQNLILKIGEWALPDVLKTLGAVLYERAGRLPLQLLDELITIETGILYKTVFKPDLDFLSRKAALQCFENICIRGVPYVDDYYADQCLHAFNCVLKSRFSHTDPIMHCKLYSIALKGIHLVVSNSKTAHVTRVGEILAALKAFIFFGREDPSIHIAAVLKPVPFGVAEGLESAEISAPVKPDKRAGKKKVKKNTKKEKLLEGDDEQITEENKSEDKLNQIKWRELSESESEFSESEGGGLSKSCQARVRQHALITLHSVIKATTHKIIFGYWTSFLPSGPESIAGSLAAVIRDDSNSKVKMAALIALSSFMEQSKFTLLIATDSESASNMPFTPFSVQLAGMIKELHRLLFEQLSAQSSYLIITHLIKCLSVVISNSPYQKLESGLLSKSVHLIYPYLQHRDVNARVAALTCLGAVFSVHSPLAEVCQIIHTDPSCAQSNRSQTVSASLPGTPPSLSVKDDTTKSGVAWIVRTCAKLIDSSFPKQVYPLPVRVEALQTLSSLVTGYLPQVRSSLPFLADVINKALDDKDSSVQLHAAKLADNLASAISKCLAANLSAGEESKRSQPLDTKDEAQGSILPLDNALFIWNALLSGPLISIMQSQNNTQLKAFCCDVISHIGATVFQSLQAGQQIMVITILLGLASDQSSLVRESSCRALGVFVLFSSQRTDVRFVADVANALIFCVDDESSNVRVVSAWSLANLTDALVLNLGSEEIADFSRQFSDVLLMRLFEVAVSRASDTDKVRYNVMRILGNLLRYTRPHTLEKRNMSPIAEKSVKLLISNLNQGTMKVRWNACYALGNMLQNDALFSSGHPTWLEQVFTGLCLTMKNSKNFKVRINAASGIQTARQRYKYGTSDLFTSIWKYVIEAMVESNKTEDFTNYKYMESLKYQLCSALVHLISLIEQSDLLPLAATLFSREDILMKYLDSCADRLDLTSAVSNVASLDKLSLGPDSKSVIKVLRVILSTESSGTRADITSAFKACYD